jgi:hypothetical protein
MEITSWGRKTSWLRMNSSSSSRKSLMRSSFSIRSLHLEVGYTWLLGCWVEKGEHERHKSRQRVSHIWFRMREIRPLPAVCARPWRAPCGGGGARSCIVISVV